MSPRIVTRPAKAEQAVPRPQPVAGSPGADTLFFTEDTDPYDKYVFGLAKIVYRGRTAFQDVLIADSENFGRLLVLDGAIQSAAEDEALYHEILVHPAMLGHRCPRDVLIIGGGEGATLREVLAHRSVEHVTMIDLDAELVKLCRDHLQTWHRGAFDDPRVKLIFGDGRKVIEQDGSMYDVVIVDVVDMLDNGPAQSLYTRQFYELLRSRLRPNAVVVVQGMEFSFLDFEAHTALRRTLHSVFAEVESYRTSIPSFLAAWGFLIASDWLKMEEISAGELDQRISDRISQSPAHITGPFIKAGFVHCRETLALLDGAGPILEDGVSFRIDDDDSTTA
jgi:spermidine synthase